MTERYGEATKVRAFDGEPSELTEMDALVAYLQVLGRLTDAAHDKPVAAAEEMSHGLRPRHARRVLEDLRPVLPDRAVASASCVYAFWPSNKKRFDTRRASSILDDEDDKPWQ